jgi:hypothetical protein
MNANNTANKKTIPKKTMGYLKFAHFIITSIQNDSATIHNLFVEKSIDDIIALVNHVLINGDQDKTINDLRKQFIHSNKTKPKTNPKPNPNLKPKTKNTKPKTTTADAIVADLVSLARAETTVDAETPVVQTIETPVVETIETPVKTPKKSRVKKPIVVQETNESIVQETNESIVHETTVVQETQESIVHETTVVHETQESIVHETPVVQETIVQESIVTKKSKPRVKKTA